MAAPVIHQLGFLDERPLTHIALVGLLAGMNTSVAVQIIVLGKGFVADLAAVRLLSGVGSLVFLEV